MSLNVSGIIAIFSKPERIELKGGKSVMYTFESIAADRFEAKKRHKYKTSVIVPISKEGEAVKKLIKNKVLQVHSGKWMAEEKDWGDKKVIYNKLYISWMDISVLEWATKKEKGETNEQQAN